MFNEIDSSFRESSVFPELKGNREIVLAPEKLACTQHICIDFSQKE